MLFLEILILVIFVLFSLIFPEYIKRYIAYRLGDFSADMISSLKFSFTRYIDWFGTIILPLLILCISSGTLIFGYAKSKTINSYNFKNPKKDMSFIALAAALVNLFIAFFLILLFKLGLKSHILIQVAAYNLVLILINFLPIPPFMGVNLLTFILPTKLFYNYIKLKILGLFFVVFLFLFGLFRAIIILINNLILPILGV